MGWRGQHNRERDAERRWRSLPLRERYNWATVAILVALVIAFGAAFWTGVVAIRPPA